MATLVARLTLVALFMVADTLSNNIRKLWVGEVYYSQALKSIYHTWGHTKRSWGVGGRRGDEVLPFIEVEGRVLKFRGINLYWWILNITKQQEFKVQEQRKTSGSNGQLLSLKQRIWVRGGPGLALNLVLRLDNVFMEIAIFEVDASGEWMPSGNQRKMEALELQKEKPTVRIYTTATHNSSNDLSFI